VSIQTYRDLEVWRVAMDLAEQCYLATRPFPREELFGMTGQIRRAAASVPANIAEGQGRRSTKEFLNHLSIAKGSLCEVETHLILSHRVGLLPHEQLDPLLDLAERIGRMLAQLRKSLELRL